ncbi:MULTISPECIES: twin-arginine translocation signal domain-containing protein [Pseudomonas]|nr:MULTISPECIES: twin-arginine translocation signal domain-containing protein [Pseudomonas]
MFPNHIYRRDFLKMSTAAALAAGTGMSMYTEHAKALVPGLTTLLSVDPITLEYKVFGPCCHFCPNKLIVSHYQPVVLCEVVKGGTDTVLGNPVSSPLGVGVDKNDYTTFDVRLWEIPDWAVDIAMGFQGCKMCGVAKAKSVAVPNDLTGVCALLTDKAVAAATSAANSALPSCFPKLLYSTELDPTWRTGCRDILKAQAIVGLLCNNVGSLIQIPGFETCIGTNWGPLYPRQMAGHYDNPVIQAGIAAYRALHVSRFSIGSLPFDASLSVGKLQQTAPATGVGFGAGSLMLDTEVRLGNVSLANVYSFVWWVPVVCCKPYNDVFGVCKPSIPCTPGG